MEEIKKFGFELNKTDFHSYYFIFGVGFAIVFMIIFALTYRPLSYLFLLVGLYFAILLIAGLINDNKKWIYISLVAALFVGFFLFAIIYTYVPEPLGLLLLSILYVLVGIISLINNCLLNRANKV